MNKTIEEIKQLEVKIESVLKTWKTAFDTPRVINEIATFVESIYTPNTEIQKEREEAYKKGYMDGVLSYQDNNLFQTKGGKE